MCLIFFWLIFFFFCKNTNHIWHLRSLILYQTNFSLLDTKLKLIPKTEQRFLCCFFKRAGFLNFFAKYQYRWYLRSLIPESLTVKWNFQYSCHLMLEANKNDGSILLLYIIRWVIALQYVLILTFFIKISLDHLTLNVMLYFNYYLVRNVEIPCKEKLLRVGVYQTYLDIRVCTIIKVKYYTF